ncbi:hypothetical protein NE237_028450 [Protea cynaroides]|uniref:Uncharacterized protein n=1 Tax=Protea cynaroides TaxID=273540 RepID=A0A9Q0JVA5_9MAGN|nr:hypothetical protein NE237_028450 [Protea cynaroides]
MTNRADERIPQDSVPRVPVRETMFPSAAITMVNAGMRSAAGLGNQISIPLVSMPVRLNDQSASCWICRWGSRDSYFGKTYDGSGKVLGFSSMETEWFTVRNNSGKDSVLEKHPNAISGRNRDGRKRCRWLARDKDKFTIGVGDATTVSGEGNSSDARPRSKSQNPGQNSNVRGRSFTSVLSGIPDLSNLPDPVFKGSITRIVIPQATYERQLKKYKWQSLVRCLPRAYC